MCRVMKNIDIIKSRLYIYILCYVGMNLHCSVVAHQSLSVNCDCLQRTSTPYRHGHTARDAHIPKKRSSCSYYIYIYIYSYAMTRWKLLQRNWTRVVGDNLTAKLNWVWIIRLVIRYCNWSLEKKKIYIYILCKKERQSRFSELKNALCVS